MIDSDIDTLTQRLEDLRLERDRINREESRLLEQLRRATADRLDDEVSSPRRPNTSGNSSTQSATDLGQM